MASVKEEVASGDFVDEVYKPLTVKEENGKHEGRRDSIFLYFSAIVVGLSAISIGCGSIWTSPVMKHLKSTDPNRNPLTLPITTYEVSVLSGMMAIGCFFGPIVLAMTLDRFGRKKIILVLSVLNLASFIIAAFARTVFLYYLCRFLFGISMSSIGAIPIYITEISENHNRGRLGVILGLFFPLGSLYASLIGPFFSVRIFSLLCAIPVLTSICLMAFFIPESPIHLTALGKKHKVVKALTKFRNKSPTNIEKDYQQIERTLNEFHRNKTSFLTLFRDKSLRKAYIISISVIFFQMGSGNLIILSFLAPIFDEAGVGVSGDLVAIIVLSVKITFFFIASIAVERAGRRPLLLFSSFGTMMSLFNIGLYFYLKSNNYSNLSSITWLPVTSIVLYFISYSLGFGPIPFTLMSELFPSNTRTIAVSSILTIIAVLLAAMGFGFPIVEDFVGTAYCFWIFSIFCFFGLVTMFFIVPETKGKDSTEIQKMLSR